MAKLAVEVKTEKNRDRQKEFRPRISASEAAFIVEAFEKAQAYYEKLAVELFEQNKQNLEEKTKAELTVIRRKIFLFHKLICKYRLLAQGFKGKGGRYPLTCAMKPQDFQRCA